jgi:hypothetical protein
MKFLKYLSVSVLALALMACGGGGGSAGTPSSGAGSGTGTGTSTTPTPTPTPTTTPISVSTISLSIVDAKDVVVTSNAIGSGALFFVRAVVLDASGTAVANKLVTFTTDATIATLAQTSALTGTNGVAKVQISPVSLNTTKAANLIAAATVGKDAVSASLDYQTSAANVTLTNLLVAKSSISALQSSAVTVEGRVNGALAGSSVVAVNFSASCGSFSPASASTSNAGLISTTYQSSVACSGNVVLTAQAAGADAVTTTINVSLAQPANVVFSSATVPLMVSSAAATGLKQSTVGFQVLDSSGTGMPSRTVNISLASAAISAGVTFSVGGVASVAPQSVTTDSNGFAFVTVSAGGLPTPVVLTATLASNATVTASSSGVAVTSGRATQNAASLSATALSIEGFNTDGIKTTLTMRVADRQGNPVPAGAVVNFVASNGLVQGTCSIDANSQCGVTYTTQGIRPSNGRVAILAYMDGEESFVDLNGDNIWQTNEPFFAVGSLYRDDNENDVYDPLSEQTYPGGTTGVSACADAAHSYPSIVNTCDNVTWSDSIRVRQQIVIALATKDAAVSLVGLRTSSGFSVRVADLNGNSMPTGTTVSAAVITPAAICKVTTVSPNIVRNSSNGGNHSINLDGASDCATVKIDVTVTTPSGALTVAHFAGVAALTTTAGPAPAVPVGTTLTYPVSGGRAPYTVTTSDATKATASISSSTLILTGVSVGTSNVIVSDASGQNVLIAVTVQ